MAKSARSSALKKNNQRLKKKVFGPAELARAERLNKKLLELAQAPKPSEESKMDVEAPATDHTVESRSNTAIKKAREAKKNRIEKKRVRKERNKIAFTRTKRTLKK